MTRVISYDVFDTVITRLVGDPQSLFLLVGRHLANQGAITCSPQAFCAARVTAEATARRLKRLSEEVSLNEIYLQLACLLHLNDETCSSMQRAEISFERRLTVGVPKLLKELANLRKHGNRIVFTSDMYLPTETVRELLAACDAALPCDKVYVSSDTKVKKISGRMFSLVCANEGIAMHQLEHHGDRLQSDVTPAKRLGVSAHLRTHCRLNRYEQLMEKYSAATDAQSSLMAGASRYTRLHAHSESERANAIVEVTAGVAAPLLASYVIWTLRRANELKLSRLYFVSRDGFILKKMAEAIMPRLNVKVELRYLYGSRQAWHLPSLTNSSLFDEDWLTICSDPWVSLRDLLARVSIAPEEIESTLDKVGLSAKSFDEAIDAKGRRRFIELLQLPQFRDLALDRAQAAREQCDGYFQQEGLFDCDNWAIVDVGWRGRAQRSLARIINHRHKMTVRGFYLGLRDNALSEEAGQLEAFLFDGRKPFGIQPSQLPLDVVVEMFCAAPHGSVVGYERRENAYLPRMLSESNDAAKRWGLEMMQESLLMFANSLPVEFMQSNSTVNGMLAELLEMFWNNPSTEEANAWGSFPISSDQAGNHHLELASPRRLYEISDVLINGRLTQQHPWNWSHASIRRSSNLFRALLPIMCWSRRIISRALRGPKRAIAILSSDP